MEQADWQPIETAPKDGTDVYLPLEWHCIRAYWCGDLKRWVLSRPLHVESIHDPKMWSPTKPPAPRPTPEGWQMVPVEPTEEMIGEGGLTRIRDSKATVKDIYRNMLKAAPAAPPTGVGTTAAAATGDVATGDQRPSPAELDWAIGIIKRHGGPAKCATPAPGGLTPCKKCGGPTEWREGMGAGFYWCDKCDRLPVSRAVIHSIPSSPSEIKD